MKSLKKVLGSNHQTTIWSTFNQDQKLLSKLKEAETSFQN